MTGTSAQSPADIRRALLARRLRARPAAQTVPRRPDGPAPLSYAQERLFFLDRHTAAGTAYTIPFVQRLRGPLDTGRLRAALAAAAGRHVALRTRFTEDADGVPLAAIAADADGCFPLTEAAAPGPEEARALVDAFLQERFDLAAGPTARALLIRLAAGDHVLALAVHHIAADGWSMGVLWRDLMAAYTGVPQPEPPVGYDDFAAWQRARAGDPADLAYWRDHLAGVAPLDLPTDRPRPAEQTYAGAAHGFTMGEELTAGLTALGQDHGATPFMTLTAALAALLGHAAGQDDVTVGSPVAGRAAPELDDVVGCFLNMLTLRVDLAGDPTFTELLLRVREVVLGAFTHQELPFERLVADLNVARDVARSPLFQVILSMQNYEGTVAGGDGGGDGLDVEGFSPESWSTRYDLELYVTAEGPALSGTFIYNTALFDAATVQRLAGRLVALLRAAVAAPDTRLAALGRPDADERRLVVEAFNDTAAEHPADVTVHGLIVAQAARTPDAVAVRCGTDELSYVDLDRRSAALAGALAERGVGPGDVVAIRAERSVELVVALLGILRSGAAYLPLDPEYPAERLDFMVADSGARLVLDRGLLPPANDTAAPDRGGPHDTAYVIYTSGSTGRPKGVANAHRGIVNRLLWMQDEYRLGPDDVVLQKTPTSFDVSVWELFWPLLAGARLVLAAPGGHKDAAYLRDLIAAERVTTVHFVPSMLAMFLAADGVERCATLRRVICSGEELPVDLARRCLQRLPARLFNLYGPTEAAIDVSAWECREDALRDRARVPIGAPVDNTRLYVLDAHGEPVGVGVPGELYIGGVQVATGYVGRPALTAERFVPDPFGPPGARLYRTGDRARWRADGTVEFLGRLDHQVKLRGFRIELGEIEAALRAQAGIDDAVVLVREDRPGDQRLVAYLVGGEPDRAALRRSLPDFMVPTAYVRLDALPLTPNGKLDRRALPAPVTERDASVALVPPATPTEHAVAEVWREALDVTDLGVDDDFFDLGGHSLTATRVVARLRRLTDARVSVMDLFKHRTVRELARLIDAPPDAAGQGLLHELTPRRTGTPALSFVCVPYGGGSAVVYQPLADALPATHALWALAIPGHDIGLREQRLPFDELAAACVAEIQQKVTGPVALYGHCVGSALTVEIARRLEAAGRDVEAVYIGASFPFARPKGPWSRLGRRGGLEALRSDRGYQNWLVSMGIAMNDLDPGQAREIVRAMRREAQEAKEYFSGLFSSSPARLRAPMVTVAGEYDPDTDYYQERYREWHFLADRSAVVVLREAGHYFLKYRAGELAAIVTRAHRADAAEVLPGPGDGDGWWLHAVSTATGPVAPAGPQPSMGRFLPIAAGQLVSLVGSALTEFAVPLWIYVTTGSLARFALFAVIGLVPGILVMPLAGTIVDRYDRRRVMMIADAAAGLVQLAMGVLLWTGHLQVWHIYPLLGCLSVALTFQRLAYGSAIPQLVPKRYLGHANGIVQSAQGTAQLLVPLIAAGLLAAIGLSGILVIDVVSYAVAVLTVALIRFPGAMAWRRRESVLAELTEGVRYSWGNTDFRRLLRFFAILNIFLSPLFLLVSPLVLSLGGLGDVARASFAGGIGVTLGGLAMTIWGGPRRQRVRGMALAIFGLAVGCLIAGARPDLLAITVGAGVMSLGLTLLNGIYFTLIQVKVPQRFHGRVLALNTLVAWSTLPLGFGVIAPLGSALAGPLLEPGGALASTVGVLIGTGPGRGIALIYLVFALAMAAWAATALRGRLARFDQDVPDALPDDLIGLEALRRQDGPATGESR
ncbi:amino acid adenylation domain-containing protein [Dactylosporangium salmoneum]|uniref:Carrier domain-containing protein n=1 Tax=Dactylosporangium salmoneum TaxID=53361 RepID=A0ABP5V3L7_9ACTN